MGTEDNFKNTPNKFLRDMLTLEARKHRVHFAHLISIGSIHFRQRRRWFRLIESIGKEHPIYGGGSHVRRAAGRKWPGADLVPESTFRCGRLVSRVTASMGLAGAEIKARRVPTLDLNSEAWNFQGGRPGGVPRTKGARV